MAMALRSTSFFVALGITMVLAISRPDLAVPERLMQPETLDLDLVQDTTVYAGATMPL